MTEGIRAQVTLAEITPAAVTHTQASDVTRKQVHTDFVRLPALLQDYCWDIQSGYLSMSFF